MILQCYAPPTARHCPPAGHQWYYAECSQSFGSPPGIEEWLRLSGVRTPSKCGLRCAPLFVLTSNLACFPTVNEIATTTEPDGPKAKRLPQVMAWVRPSDVLHSVTTGRVSRSRVPGVAAGRALSPHRPGAMMSRSNFLFLPKRSHQNDFPSRCSSVHRRSAGRRQCVLRQRLTLEHRAPSLLRRTLSPKHPNSTHGTAPRSPAPNAPSRRLLHRTRSGHRRCSHGRPRSSPETKKEP